MSHFYQYDTRGASHASQIINLERMVAERDEKIERLQNTLRDCRFYVSDEFGNRYLVQKIDALLGNTHGK